MAITLEELQIIFRAETGNMKEQIGGIQSQLAGFEQSAVKSQKTLGLFGKAAIVAGVAKAGKAMAGMGKEALLMANDVVESEQLFEISLGKMADKATAWSDELGNALGLNPYALRKNTGIMNVMLGSMGMSEEAAYDMSTSLTQLSEDMASFYNMSSEEAFSKIQSGMTGMAMPLKQMGILVDEETIKQYAMANGISKTGKEMTQQQKVMARYGTIMEQTRKAQGDLARTLDSPTNQLRILNNQFDQAKIALGQALQPALIAVLPHVTRFATGLAGLMTGGAKVSTDATRKVDEIRALKDELEAAVKEFGQASSATKNLILEVQMDEPSTVRKRVIDIIDEFEAIVGEESTREIKEKILAKIDAAIEDGVIDPQEIEDAIEELRIWANKEIKKKKLELDKTNAQTKLDLKHGKITEDEAAELDRQAQTRYDEDVGVIEGIVAKATANLNITDWDSVTIPPGTMAKIEEAIKKEVEAANAANAKAGDVMAGIFSGTGSAGEAFLGFYEGLIEDARAKGEELSKAAIEGLTQPMTPEDLAALAVKRQEVAKALEYINKGIVDGDLLNMALMGGVTSAEDVRNVFRAYNEEISKNRESERAILAEQKMAASPYMYDENYLKSLGESGYTFQSWMDELERQANARADVFDSNKIMALGRGMTDALNAMDVSKLGKVGIEALALELKTFFESVDPASLTGPAIDAYNNLVDASQKVFEAQYESSDIASVPGQYRAGLYTPPAWYLQNPPVVDSLVIDKPKVELKDPGYVSSKGWMSPGSMPPQSVNVEVTPTPVTLYLDGYVVAQSTVTYTPKVVRSSGSGGAPKLPMMELN